jgi:hypothetical protein
MQGLTEGVTWDGAGFSGDPRFPTQYSAIAAKKYKTKYRSTRGETPCQN